MVTFSLLVDKDQLNRLKKHLALMWAFMVMYTVASTVVSLRMGDCSSASPDILYYITGGLISLSWAWQYWMTWHAAVGWVAKLVLTLAIVLGGIVLMDFFTDSQQLSLATLCDASF